MGLFERLENVEPLIAANPQGINQYDKGMSFEEATGGVVRDEHGRFAPEGGNKRTSHVERFRRSKTANAADRAARRRASIQRSRAAEAEKRNKKSDAEAKKAEREAEKKKREAQQLELANISLQISNAVAEGNSIKAAQLRIERAQKVLEFADTQVERVRAQTALNNAKTRLANMIRAKRTKGAKIESREEGF